jgi:hypothetical protein
MTVYGIMRCILLEKCGKRCKDECICMVENMEKVELNILPRKKKLTRNSFLGKRFDTAWMILDVI